MAPLLRGCALAVTLAACGAVWAQGRPAAAAAPAAAASAPEAAARTIRKELGDALEGARAAFLDGKFDAAAARLEAADALPNLSALERISLERMRAAVALRQERVGVALRALEAALDTGEVPAADELEILGSLVNLAAREKDFARVLKWSQRYTDKGGTADIVQIMRLEALRFSGDERGALQGWKARRAAAERNGARMDESHLRVLWALQRRHEPADAGATMEALARAYPRPEYFAELASVASQAPELTDRGLLALYRLLRVTGSVNSPGLALEMAERALRVGFPGEGAAVLEEAQKAGVLPGNRGEDMARVREALQRALASDERDRAASEAAARQASDGTRLADLGWASVAALPVGAPPENVRPGLELLEQGVARGGLRRESEARLNLAVAQFNAGRRENALATVEALARQLTASATPDPLAGAVRLWGLFLAAPAMLPPRR